MVAPGFLHDLGVRRWLDGLEPAWTLLELQSLNALRREPSRAFSHLKESLEIPESVRL